MKNSAADRVLGLVEISFGIFPTSNKERSLLEFPSNMDVRCTGVISMPDCLGMISWAESPAYLVFTDGWASEKEKLILQVKAKLKERLISNDFCKLHLR